MTSALTTAGVPGSSDARAQRSTSTEPAVERWQTCSRAPAAAASIASRATIDSSALAGQPVRPSRAATGPSWACAPTVSRWSSACWATTASSERAYSSARRMISGSFTHRPSSENIRTAAGEAAIIPISASRSPAEADGDRADRVDVDQPDLAAPPPDVLDDDGRVLGRGRVRHREDRGVAAEGGRGRPGGDRLGLLAPGFAQVGVQVDQARAGRSGPSASRTSSTVSSGPNASTSTPSRTWRSVGSSP